MAQQLQQPPPLAFVTFSAEINQNTTESLIAAMTNLVNQGVQEIHLLLSTPGGGVTNGLNLYNVLTGLPVRLITHNVGVVNSIGNAVFLAGNPRYAVPETTFMFHGVGMDVNQAARFEEKQLRELLGNILTEQGKIAAVVEKRTKLTERQVKALFTKAQTKDTAFAIGAGIIDEIRDVQIPPGSPVVSLIFQR
jgi:ATP-dependent Clp protease protease subunit